MRKMSMSTVLLLIGGIGAIVWFLIKKFGHKVAQPKQPVKDPNIQSDVDTEYDENDFDTTESDVIIGDFGSQPGVFLNPRDQFPAETLNNTNVDGSPIVDVKNPIGIIPDKNYPAI